MMTRSFPILAFALFVAPLFGQNQQSVERALTIPPNTQWNMGAVQYAFETPRPKTPKVLKTLGIRLRQISDDAIYDHIEIDRPTGLIVNVLDDQLAAADAGLRINDILFSVNGNAIVTVDDFVKLYESAEDENVAIEFIQGGKRSAAEINRAKAIEQARDYRIGIVIDSVPDGLRKHLDLNGGIFVTKVMDESPAASSGIRANDIIVAVDDEKIEKFGELNTAVDQSKGRELGLSIIRAGRPVELRVTPEESPEEETVEYLVVPQLAASNIESLALLESGPQTAQHLAQLTATVEKLSKEIANLKAMLKAKE